VTIYGQTELVKDLIAARLDSGAPIVFDAADVRVDGIADAPLVRYRVDEAATELHAEFVAGCDGFHGVCRTLAGPEALDTWEREYPFAWLGILADVPPSTDELIYARHAYGFALHSMRSETVSRLYLQVAPDEDPVAWSDDRIWDELSVRLHADGFTLQAGPIRDKSVTPMRGFVAAPMRRPAAARRRRRPHRSGDPGQGPEPRGRGRGPARRRSRRPLRDRLRHRPGRVLRPLSAPRLARAALLLVDDVDAPRRSPR
jgi:2-polyprenyl-6-methoxyphenol hydroxylase-like FAD-dependent oxidoreductase